MSHGTTRSCAALGVAGALLVLATSAGAQTSHELTDYAGAYTYARSLDHGRRVVRGAIESGIKQLTPILRPFARIIMSRQDPLVHRFTIRIKGARVFIRTVGEKTHDLSTKLGVARTITTPEGKRAQLTYRFVGGRLEQYIKGKKGSRQDNVFLLSKGGKAIRFRAAIYDRRIKTPVRFSLHYKRTASGSQP